MKKFNITNRRKFSAAFDKFRGIFQVFLLLFFVQTVSGQEPLDNYLTQAAANNPGLKSSFNDYMAALQVAPQVKALPDPQVAFGYFIEPVETRKGPQQFKISVSQMFPWFGTLKARENSAAQMAKARYEAFEEAKSKLFNDVRSTYFDLYFTGKAIAITTENIRILGSFQKLATIKVESGMVSMVDEYRLEMEIGDLENQLALLKDTYHVQEVMFNNLINSEQPVSVQLPEQLQDPDPVLSKEAIHDSILVQNHQLLNLDLQAESFRFKQDAARKTGMPEIKIGFDYTIIGKGDNNMEGTDAIMLPSVGLTIPLYRNKYKAMLKEAVYQETAKKEEKLNKQNVLETIFEQTWKDLSDAERRITLNKKQAELAKKTMDLLETEYSTSSRNFEEILRMERKLLKYRFELEKARTDKQAARSYLSYLMGK